MRRVSVVIPVFNESATVGEILRRVLAVGPAIGMEIEVIVVDDGSDDDSASIVRAAAAVDERIRLLEHPTNRGKGAALRTGFAAVSGDVVVVQDADLEYDPRDYPALLEPLRDGRADVVYGSRFLGGPHRVHMFWHYVGNRALTFLSNALNNLNLTDMETCYKAFRADILRDLPLRSDDFAFEPEFTAKVARRRLRIYEVPVSYSGRSYSEGKKITWRDGFRALWAIVRYRVAD
jgi:glycosyltransferase involved in cell wall biosynthesis